MEFTFSAYRVSILDKKLISRALDKLKTIFGVLAFFIANTGLLSAQSVKIDINLNIKHSVDGVSDFGRDRHMTIHSSPTERDWDGHEDMRDYLINDLDVYFGRDNGSAGWKNRLVTEDPDKPHWPDVKGMISIGDGLKNWYENDDGFALDYQYKDRGSMIMGTTPAPTYPTLDWADYGKTNSGFQTYDVDASAFWVANYLDKFFAKSPDELGEPLPQYWEVINEPDMDILGAAYMFLSSPEKVFEYHNETAQRIREIFGNKIKIGGMTWGQHDLHLPDLVWRMDPQFYYDNSDPALFPVYDNMLQSTIWTNRHDNWWQWDGMYQSFIDAAGANMDFYSIHLYDWPDVNDGGTIRAGGHVEAMLDLIEWYDVFKFGERKEIIVSEFGSVSPLVHNLPYKRRDWENLRPFNQMFMQFLERPSHVTLTMPFAPVKAQWGDIFDASGNLIERYSSTLMDPVGEYTERPGESRYDHNEWEWSANVLFFELWKDVDGTRIDTKSSDRDVQVDAYVNENHVYLIVNNLEVQPKTIELFYFDDYENPVVEVNTRQLYLNESLDRPVIDYNRLKTAPATFVLEKSGTVVLDYEFSQPVTIDQESKEFRYMSEPLSSEMNKYGSQLCHVTVNGRTPLVTNVNNVTVPAKGEATLRIGGAFWDETPESVTINGHELVTGNENWRGRTRNNQWFGVFEIDVPLEYLLGNNEVSCTVEGNVSEYSSVILQVWDFSKEPGRSSDNYGLVAIQSISILGETDLMQGTQYPLQVEFLPVNTTDKLITWKSNNEAVATVDEFGVVSIISNSGTATISAISTSNPAASATFIVNAIPFTATAVTGIDIINGPSIEIEQNTNKKLVAEIYPLDATIQTVEWTSSNSEVVEVISQSGKIIGKKVNESAVVTATIIDTESGNTVYSDEIIVFVTLAGGERVYCRDLPSQLRPYPEFSLDLPVATMGQRTLEVELTKDFQQFAFGTVDFEVYGETTQQVKYNLTTTELGTGFQLTARLKNGSDIIDECSVEVEMLDHFRAESVSILDGIRKVKFGESIDLTARVLPDTTFNKTVFWQSSNPSIASVDQLTGTVTGVSAGDVEITVTTDDGGHQDVVTVTSQAEDVVIPIVGLEVDKTEVILYPGTSLDLNVNYKPEWTTQTNVNWQSDNEAIVTVNALGELSATNVEGATTVRVESVDDQQVFALVNVKVSKTVIVEAEDFVSTGGPFDGFKVNDLGTGINYNQTGDWADYTVDIPQGGEYELVYFVGAPVESTDAAVNLYVDGELKFKTTIPPGTGWEDYVEIDGSSTVLLTKGVHTIRIESTGTSEWQWNMDWFSLTNLGSTDVSGVSVSPSTMLIGIGQKRFLEANVFPDNALDRSVVWSSSDPTIATVDILTGEVTGAALGDVDIFATTNDGGFTDKSIVTVQTDIATIPVESILLDPLNQNLVIGETLQLAIEVKPIDADDKSVTWSSADDAIATVSISGLVEALAVGEVEITAKANDGSEVSGTSTIKVSSVAQASIAVDSPNKYLTTNYTTSGSLDVTVIYDVGSGNTIVDGGLGGVQVMLREIAPDWSVVKDYPAVSDISAIGKESGTSIISIPLNSVTPSAELTPGNFYFLFPRMVSSDGVVYNVDGLAPITIIEEDPVISVESITITPESAILEQGGTVQLTATVLPANATNSEVVWSSNDELVATVEDGLVTAIGAGMSIIIATTVDGNKSATSMIEVAIPTGILDKKGEDIQVFPNSATKEIFIVSRNYFVFNYSITDSQGKLINESVVETGQPITIENLSPGVYFLSLSNKSISRSFRIIKQ